MMSRVMLPPAGESDRRADFAICLRQMGDLLLRHYRSAEPSSVDLERLRA